MKKLVLVFFIFIANVIAFEKMEKLVITGPVATVSHPFFKMIQDGALSDVAKSVEFIIWKNPDELRAILLNKGAHFVAIPTNVAANLYNKNIDIKLLNVPVWGILEILTRDKNIKSIEDFKGKEIVVPFRSDMPDIVLQAIIKKAGLDVKKDFTLRYVATPPDAMQMLILRRADNVLLAEPATSMAMRKTGSFPVKLIAPEIYRGVKLEKEWGRVFKADGKIPIAGVGVVGNIEPKIVQRFNDEYQKALEWYKSNPKEAGELVAKNIDLFKPEAISDSIAHVQLQNSSAYDSKAAIEDFFKNMLEIEPKLIGGKLPSDGFYYK
ncbi:MAG: NitT/TauT family transport system substrate-binding protein [Campylobacterota bacterium]|nr:NitT/TauT family transport system substrate-binding protein [Campylobacterota bacterium]